MSFPLVPLVSWVVQSLVTVGAVATVSKNNPSNTLPRAMLVTLVVTVIGALFINFVAAVFIVPLLLGVVLWFVVYMGASGLGPLQALGVGVMQVVIGWLVSLVLGMLGLVASGAHRY